MDSLRYWVLEMHVDGFRFDLASALARELHDAVTQTLFSASLIADILPRLWEQDPAQGRAGLEELQELTRGALAEMRTLLLELLDRLGKLREERIGQLMPASMLQVRVNRRVLIPRVSFAVSGSRSSSRW